MTRATMIALLPAALWALLNAASTAEEGTAQPVKVPGVNAGLCVHLGVTDGKLTAELGRDGRFLVQGLAADEEHVARAREFLRAQKLYGRVSVERSDFRNLPCAEGVVNLMVVGAAAKGVNTAEVVRVLAPGGVACFAGGAPEIDELKPLKSTGGWAVLTKPRPAEMSEWSHRFNSPGGNRTSRDRLVGPPARMRWAAGATWSTVVKVPEGMVAAGGRVFYARSEKPSARAKGNWNFLFARDAFSGVLLWKRPATGFERLATVATADRLYTTISSEGPLVALDAATGELAKTYNQGGKVDWAMVVGEKLLVSESQRGPVPFKCLDRASGELLWTSQATVSGVRLLNVIVEDENIFFVDHRNRKLGCADLATGKTRWTVDVSKEFPAEKHLGVDLSCYGAGVLVLGGTEGQAGTGIHAYSAEDGKKLWDHNYQLIIGGRAERHKTSSYADVFFIDGLFWTHVGRPFSKQVRGMGDYWQGLDPATGEPKKKFPYPDEHRAGDPCYPDQATVRYFMGGKTYFIDMKTGKFVTSMPAIGIHGGCGFGVIPANGLVYTCSMYTSYYTFGDFALAPGPAITEPDPTPRLEKGPAFGTELGAEAGPDDWPCFRHDIRHSARSDSAVPTELKELWAADVGSRPGAPTVAGGKVFVASIEEYSVKAFDAANGRENWSFTAGGRVKVPPQYHKGLCIFGCSDGYAYCLRAADGKLVWRFRAARADRRIVDHDRLESVWPADSGALVVGDTLYVGAGREGMLDGGIDVHALDPVSGEIKWTRRTETYGPLGLLASDGKSLAMSRAKRFTLDGSDKKPGMPVVANGAFLADEIDPADASGVCGFKEQVYVPVTPKAMAGAGDVVFVAGLAERPEPVRSMPKDLAESEELNLCRSKVRQLFEWVPQNPRNGEEAYFLWAYSAPKEDVGGKRISELRLPAPPAFDAMAAAGGRLYLCTLDGRLRCFGKK